jgi:hypothetical protein
MFLELFCEWRVAKVSNTEMNRSLCQPLTEFSQETSRRVVKQRGKFSVCLNTL